jgi:GNAT superfamily N-acetyltransferase
MNEPRLIEDAWLGRCLGKQAYHLVGDLAQLCRPPTEIANQLCNRHLFADVKVPVENVRAAEEIQRLGFMLIDTNLRLSLQRSDVPRLRTDDITFATLEMADAVGDIAATSFTEDRFHRDPAISNDTADNLKRSWATNFFSRHRGDWMVVAQCGAETVGFLQLLRSPEDALVIDLIGVIAEHRGRGLAGAMIAFACASCDCAGPVVVGTQVANATSVRLYEKLGFRLTSAQYVFHHHGSPTC